MVQVPPIQVHVQWRRITSQQSAGHYEWPLWGVKRTPFSARFQIYDERFRPLAVFRWMRVLSPLVAGHPLDRSETLLLYLKNGIQYVIDDRARIVVPIIA